MTPGSLRPGQKQFPRNLKFAEDLFCNRGNSLQVAENDLSIGQQQQLVIFISLYSRASPQCLFPRRYFPPRDHH